MRLSFVAGVLFCVADVAACAHPAPVPRAPELPKPSAPAVSGGCALVRMRADRGELTSRGVTVGELVLRYARSWRSSIRWSPHGQAAEGAPVPIRFTFTPGAEVDRVANDPFLARDTPVPGCTFWWGLLGKLQVASEDGLWDGAFDVELKLADDGTDVIALPTSAAQLGVAWPALGYPAIRNVLAELRSELGAEHAVGELWLEGEGPPGGARQVVARWQFPDADSSELRD